MVVISEDISDETFESVQKQRGTWNPQMLQVLCFEPILHRPCFICAVQSVDVKIGVLNSYDADRHIHRHVHTHEHVSELCLFSPEESKEW